MSIFSQLKDKVTQYVDVYVKLFKLNFIGRTANLLSYFMFSMIALFIVFCMLLFTGLGLVEVFVLAGMSKMASFFLTIGIYFLLLLIVVGLRKPITRFFSSSIIKVMTDGDEEDDAKQETE